MPRLRIGTAPGLLDIVDDEGGRRIDRLLQRLASELTAAETEAVRITTDPPGDGVALATRLLTAPSLAVELARHLGGGAEVVAGGPDGLVRFLRGRLARVDARLVRDVRRAVQLGRLPEQLSAAGPAGVCRQGGEVGKLELGLEG